MIKMEVCLYVLPLKFQAQLNTESLLQVTDFSKKDKAYTLERYRDLSSRFRKQIGFL